MNEEKIIALIVEAILKQLRPLEQTYYDRLIPVGLSNRHVHLSRRDLDLLFGSDYQLKKLKELQPGQFAAAETVTLVSPKGILEHVRILGPEREFSQVEISLSDGYVLGIDAPIRDSGDLKDTPGVVLVGPRGVVKLETGVICAKRHIHMHPHDAEYFQVQDKELVSVEVEGDKALTFRDVLVRVHPSFVLEMHLDRDEGNAAGLKNGQKVALKKPLGVRTFNPKALVAESVKYIREDPDLPQKKDDKKFHSYGYAQSGISHQRKVFSRKLVTEKDVMAERNKGENLYISQHTIITPLAMDKAREIGLVIERQD